MDFKNTFYLIILYYGSIRGVNAYLSPEVVRACTEIYDPTVLSTSCCPQINQLAQQNKQCASQGGSCYISNCDEIRCVTRAYNISTNGELDETKAMAVMAVLDNVDEETRSMNMLTTKWCFQGGYTSFPAKDNSCDSWKYINCAFFAYNIGCPQTRSTGDCADMKRNIDTCRPYADEYVSLLGTFSYLFDQYDTSDSDSSSTTMSREQRIDFLSRIFNL